MKAKVMPRRKPELVGRRVKRVGAIYYEVAYWDGRGWAYKEFTTRPEAREFAKMYV